MNYQETLEYLYSQLPIFQRDGKAAYKANLDNTHALDKLLQSPHKAFASIHVAGTNGKGSVSHMLASVLQAAGYKTGLYTSPHYIDFRERIRVNGACIDEAAVVEFIHTHKPFIEELQPSFFELTVAMAFQYFKQKQVEVAVIEVGMGGRLDSTNIISPLVSIITNIGFDHQQYLGESLEAIAGEKAGIIKERTPVIIGETQKEITHVFEQVARKKQAPIQYADAKYAIPYALVTLEQHQRFSVFRDGQPVYPELELDLLGEYQQKNIKPVLCALEMLNTRFPVSRDTLYAGLKTVIPSTGLMGRFMHLGYNPRIICDAGHNKEGIQLVLQQIKQIPYKKLHIVLGFVNDKKLDGVLELFPKEAFYYFTRADIPRALPVEALKLQSLEAGLSGTSISNVEDAVKKAEENAGPEDVILIGGSTFVVAEAIKYKKSSKSICE